LWEGGAIIKELKPNIPIVAQSAYALEHERAKYEGIFDDYLTKPLEEGNLKQIVMKYIDNK
jgi:CheY-like chemotaxis protein